jgi:CheY-like chemotaxis protein
MYVTRPVCLQRWPGCLGARLQAAHIVDLDLNLPRMNRREVLAEAKSDPDLKAIPVVVLTTASAEQDIPRTPGCRQTVASPHRYISNNASRSSVPSKTFG